MNIVGRDVSEVDLVDPHTVVHVERHARGRDMIGNAECGIRREFYGIPCLVREDFPRRTIFAPRICLLYGTNDLEEARASADAVCLERGGDGETDRLARAALICDHEMRRQRIESTLDTFDRGIERF